MIFFTTIPIILSTIGAFIVGALWYSPFLFQKPWMKGEGVTATDFPKRSVSYLIRIHSYSFIAHGCIAAVMAFVFELVEVNSLTTAISLGVLLSLGFIVSTRFIDMIYTTKGVDYEPKNQIRFLVSAGYYIAICITVSTLLFAVAKQAS